MGPLREVEEGERSIAEGATMAQERRRTRQPGAQAGLRHPQGERSLHQLNP